MRTFDTPRSILQNPPSDRGTAIGSSAGSEAKSKNPLVSNSGDGLVYDLRLGEASSARYYADLAAFSARTVGEIERRAADVLDGYSSYLTQNPLEIPRTRGEYGLELLTLGNGPAALWLARERDTAMGGRCLPETLLAASPLDAYEAGRRLGSGRNL